MSIIIPRKIDKEAICYKCGYAYRVHGPLSKKCRFPSTGDYIEPDDNSKMIFEEYDPELYVHDCIVMELEKITSKLKKNHG